MSSLVPAASAPLVLRGRELGRAADGSLHAVVMAIVNRTTDSFYAPARLADDDAALDAAHRAWDDGAQILDVGGVRAGDGPAVDEVDELRRVVPFVARVRDALPDLVISVDTWRSGVAREVIAAGADLINDTWAGADPHLVEVAGEARVGVVCSHTGGAVPRSDPHRVAYERLAGPLPEGPRAEDDRFGGDLFEGGLTEGDRSEEDLPGGDLPGGDLFTGEVRGGDPRDGVLLDVLATLRRSARRAVACGVPPASVLVDPTHDFGKNTWHSLHLLRRTSALAGLGYPLLMALSRKDFIGETLGLPPAERLEGTLAATTLAAWWGARVFRTHDVVETRRVLDLVAVLRDEAAPQRATRGLA